MLVNYSNANRAFLGCAVVPLLDGGVQHQHYAFESLGLVLIRAHLFSLLPTTSLDTNNDEYPRSVPPLRLVRADLHSQTCAGPVEVLDSTHYYRQTALLHCDGCCKSALGYRDTEHASYHGMEAPSIVEKEDLNCGSFPAWGLVCFLVPSHGETHFLTS